MNYKPVEERISHAWRTLSGLSLNFSRSFVEAEPTEFSRHFMVSIKLPNKTDLAAAVLLEISSQYSLVLSSSMFDLDEASISEADTIDACIELCNVLSSCLISEFIFLKEGNLGIPKRLPFGEVIQIAKSNRFSHCFKDENNNGITLYLLDQLQLNN